MSYRFGGSLRAGSGRNIRPDPARKLSANVYDIYHRCVYRNLKIKIYRTIILPVVLYGWKLGR